jgi:hypothetical protein
MVITDQTIARVGEASLVRINTNRSTDTPTLGTILIPPLIATLCVRHSSTAPTSRLRRDSPPFGPRPASSVLSPISQLTAANTVSYKGEFYCSLPLLPTVSITSKDYAGPLLHITVPGATCAVKPGFRDGQETQWCDRSHARCCSLGAKMGKRRKETLQGRLIQLISPRLE